MASTRDNDNLREGLMASCNNLARRVVRLPVNIIEGISRALSNAAPRRNPQTNPQPQQQQQHEGFLIIPEELLFVTLFERQFGNSHPFFHACRFTEALKIAKDKSKLVFLYLHSPDYPFTAPFCRDTLCSQLAREFLDANFVSWGAVANRGEGLEMASALKASTFPFCAVVAPASGKAIAVSPEELVEILQRAMDELGSAFRGLKEAEEEATRANCQLREEQDAAYLEALQKDKEKERAKELLEEKVQATTERRLKEHTERMQRQPTAKPTVSKQKETSKESIALKQKRPSTKILIRFPGLGSYQLVYFPKRIFGYEQLDMTLKDAGLFPNAALFLEQL